MAELIIGCNYLSVEAVQIEKSLRELLTGSVLILILSRILWSVSDTLLSHISAYTSRALEGDKPTVGWVMALGRMLPV